MAETKVLTHGEAASVAGKEQEKGGFWVGARDLLLGMVLGIAVTLVLNGAFTWLHTLVPAAKAPWYTVRSAGLVAYGLLWLSMVWGLLLSTRWLKRESQALTAVHEFLSLLSVVFVTLHATTLYFDSYLQPEWWRIWTPFALTSYRPVGTGVGQVAFYLMVAVTFSFYLRKRIGAKRWRTLHYFTFITYGLALVHAVVAGTDTGWTWARTMYLGSAGVVLFLTYARILARPKN